MSELKDVRRAERGDLVFIRRSDGSVVVCSKDGKASVLLEEADWASVVASMSEHGDTARAFALAERFHHGLWREHRRHP